MVNSVCLSRTAVTKIRLPWSTGDECPGGSGTFQRSVFASGPISSGSDPPRCATPRPWTPRNWGQLAAGVVPLNTARMTRVARRLSIDVSPEEKQSVASFQNPCRSCY